MRRTISTFMIVLTGAASLSAALSTREAKRIREAAAVLTELRSMPDRAIPEDLWNKAECVMVVPSLKKAAFVVGGEVGRGLMSCRREGQWSAPVFMEIGKGSWGLQIGAASVDLVLLVMNARGADKLLEHKASLGADASIAAGPVGRDVRAATDIGMYAEILSYSRTRGLFAGVDLSGGVVRPDEDANQNLYGRDVSARAVLMQGARVAPPAAGPFMAALGHVRAGE